MKFQQSDAGRQRRGRLWSTAEEVCSLLHLHGAISIGSGESLFQQLQIKAGQRVCSIGQASDILYIVKSGFLKTVMVDDFGNEQVLGFPMKSDLLGLDGICARKYMSEAVALSDCDLILLPSKTLISLRGAQGEVENLLYRMMSREVLRRQAIIGMLGAMAAEERVAKFLIALADRFAEMGYSSKMFNLRMTRQEIGSYLGMTLETVSRTLSAFNEIGLITIDHRTVRINDPDALKTLRRLHRNASQSIQRQSAGLTWEPAATT